MEGFGPDADQHQIDEESCRHRLPILIHVLTGRKIDQAPAINSTSTSNCADLPQGRYWEKPYLQVRVKGFLLQLAFPECSGHHNSHP